MSENPRSIGPYRPITPMAADRLQYINNLLDESPAGPWTVEEPSPSEQDGLDDTALVSRRRYIIRGHVCFLGASATRTSWLADVYVSDVHGEGFPYSHEQSVPAVVLMAESKQIIGELYSEVYRLRHLLRKTGGAA